MGNLGASFIKLNELGRVSNYPDWSQFSPSKNVWKFLIKIHLTKSNPKIIRGVNPPCLMPIRVKEDGGKRLSKFKDVDFQAFLLAHKLRAEFQKKSVFSSGFI